MEAVRAAEPDPRKDAHAVAIAGPDVAPEFAGELRDGGVAVEQRLHGFAGPPRARGEQRRRGQEKGREDGDADGQGHGGSLGSGRWRK